MQKYAPNVVSAYKRERYDLTKFFTFNSLIRILRIKNNVHLVVLFKIASIFVFVPVANPQPAWYLLIFYAIHNSNTVPKSIAFDEKMYVFCFVCKSS